MNYELKFVFRHDGKINQVVCAVVEHGVRVSHRAIMHVAGLHVLRGVVIAEMAYAADYVNYLTVVLVSVISA